MRGEREYHLHKALTALRTRFVEATEATARADAGDGSDLEAIRISARISRGRSDTRTDASRSASRMGGSEGSETAEASDAESAVEEEEVVEPSRRWMPGEWRMHATEHLIALGRPTYNRRDACSAVEELRGGLLDLYGASPLSNHRKQADGLVGWTREVKSSRTVHDLNILLHAFARHLPRSCFRRNIQLEKAWWPTEADDEGQRERAKDKRGDDAVPRLESVRQHLHDMLAFLPGGDPSLSHAPPAVGLRIAPALNHKATLALLFTLVHRRTKCSSDCTCSIPPLCTGRTEAYLPARLQPRSPGVST